MGKGIILRVPYGAELSSELLEALKDRFPGYTLETYYQKPDYRRSFGRRVNSLHKAFHFLLDAYPLPSQSSFLTKDTLRKYIEECMEIALDAKGSTEDLHRELEKYTAKLIELIALMWGTNNKEAIELLNEAEQYELMRHGRYDLATLMPMKVGEDISYVIQLDEALPPHYEQIINELKQIKFKRYPKTPAWVYALSEYQQAYFCNLDRKISTHTEVVQDFNSFLINWSLIKKRALNLNVELQQIAKDALPLPVWFNELSPHLREMIRVLASDPSNLDKQLSHFKKLITSDSFKIECSSTVGQISSIPQWYWVLPHHQQFFLEHVLKGSEQVEDVFSFLSSRHRTLPLPANYAAHSLLGISHNGKVIRELTKKRYRSSHIATRDGLDWPEAVQQRHSDSNLTKVMEHAQPDQLAILQTLISPIHAADYVPTLITDFLPTLPPDLELYKLARAAVDRQTRIQNLLQNNHPYNLAKRLYYTQSNDKDSLNLLAVAKKYVSTTPGLQTLLDQYKSVLESAPGTATIFDYAGRELFLSSLEQLIVLTIGGYSYGSCVSGKDRKAIELIHTDAMILYKELYGSLPVFDEAPDKENRIRFVSLVADLYMSRHHHEHAGHNAPGSEGIKTPEWYLPEDIATEIKKRLDNERALREDDRAATDNEVKNIFIGGHKKVKEYSSPKNTLLCRLVARQLGKVHCNRLYDALHPLINEKSLFIPIDSSSRWSAVFFPETPTVPDGIKQIFDLMLSTSSGKDNVVRLEKILQIVMDRPEFDESRTTATNSVYGRLRAFLRASEEDNFAELVEKTVEEWVGLFNKSKESHLSETSVLN